MIPKNVREGAVAQNLSGETQTFTIKANGKAFRTLIDGLYSNKVRAVIRELCSNARDSHIDAGRADVPIFVQIPTGLNPTFRVRDYGTSLSHNKVMHLYTTIFESSKEETNEQTGQLGLGSKSPFAYTDSFSVVTYLDGIQRLYLAFLATDGVPSITHVSTDTTDEPDGLEVSFPAKRDDCHNFAREMQFVSLGYDPGTLKVEGMDVKIPVARMSGKGWAIYPSGSFGGSIIGNNFIRMGSALYPNSIQFPHVGSSWITTVEIPIGAAEVTASRESLSYDDDTRNYVKAAMRRAATEVSDQIDAVFAAAKTRLARAKLFSEYNGVMDNLKGSTAVSLLENANVSHVGYGFTGIRRAGDVIQQARHYGKAANARGTGGRYASGIDYRHLSQFKLIVDDEERLVRRKMRVQKAGEGLFHTYIYSEPDPVERRKGVAWITECLELTPTQIIKIQDLPDYPPTKRPAGVKAAGGPRVLAPGQFWLRRHGGQILTTYGKGDHNAKYFSGNFSSALNASDLPVRYEDVFYVTQKQEEAYTKKGLLPEDRRLDIAVKVALMSKVNKLPLDQAQTLRILHQQVGECNKALLVVIDEFFPDLKIDRKKANEVINMATIAGISLQTRPIVAKVNTEITSLIARYPLLFQKSDRAHFELYVAAVKSSVKP